MAYLTYFAFLAHLRQWIKQQGIKSVLNKKDDQKYTLKAGLHTKQTIADFPKWILCIVLCTFITGRNLKVQYLVASSLRLQLRKSHSLQSRLSILDYCRNMEYHHGGLCGRGPVPYVDTLHSNVFENTFLIFMG